jgi:serine/threonine protein kinase
LKQKLNREIAAWRNLKHPNIAELLGIAYTNPNLPPGLVSRYVLRHDFLGYIGRHPEKKRSKVCTLPDASSECCFLTSGILFPKAQEVASGVQYLHENDVVHGDLKPVCARFVLAQ